MIVAVAMLMIGAMGVTAPATPAKDNPPATAALGDLSQIFASVGTRDNSDTITTTTASGFARLDLAPIHFDRDTGPVPTASLADRNAISEDQKSGTFSTMSLPDPSPSRENRITPALETPSRRAWLALAFVEHGAAAFDAYSTRQSIGHGNLEDDPVMRPFASSPAIYVATQVTPVLLDILARHMQRSEYGIFRRVWWVPQSLSAGVSILSGVHNLHIANE
ncbi:MAG: hypothetical protein WA823_17320 [Candidatus Acidiferrales bacterium]